MKKTIIAIIGISLVPFIVFAAFETTNGPTNQNPSTGVYLWPGNVQVGTSGTLLSNNPLGVFGSADSFLQVTVQNTSNTVNASADVVVNNASSTNNSYYGEFGINSPIFASSTASGEGPNDVFLTSSDGALDLQAATTSPSLGGIKFFTGGYLTQNIRGLINPSGTWMIGTTTAVDTRDSLRVATTTLGAATSTLEVGKPSQTRGSCLTLYRTDGSAIYATVIAGATAFTLSTVDCR